MSAEACDKTPTVVGVGASAGGLEALMQFFRAASATSGAAFVVVQHLDPDHDSLLADLLSRCTEMEVAQVVDRTHVQPNHVYAIPPNTSLTIEGGVLRLAAPMERRGMRMPIDHFFRALALDAGERAIGVVLSGTGADGTNGIKAIKARGGMTMAQEPEEAGYDGMPRNAIATGLIDYTLPVAEMPPALERYLEHPLIHNGEHTPADIRDNLEAMLAVLRTHTKHDFRHYKKATLVRRIKRRMGLHHIDQTFQYLRLLRENPSEAQQLFRDLLIGVTGFFREPEAFRVLEKTVIPELVRLRGRDETIRVWIPACATGEEPYSIAMLLLEQVAASRKALRVQVFATDIDEAALESARAAVYPASAVVEIPPERLERYFHMEGDSYRVNKDVREAVVFAVQNLVTDPPFSKLDLICCRNLLIYIDPLIQKKIISLFHFAMNPNGYLFLGGSETLGSQTHLFEPVSKKWRIFRKLATAVRTTVDLPMFTGGRPSARERAHLPPPVSEVAKELLLSDYAPPSILVNRRHEVLYFSGDTGPFLSPPPGEPTNDLISLARVELRRNLRATLQRAATSGDVSVRRELRLQREDSTLEFDLRVRPVRRRDREQLFLVSFEAARPAPEGVDTKELSDSALVRQLEKELEATRDDLQGSIEELETSNEELKASNEEVMSMNEELQSTNEELETSKEELQSLNEEMNAVNSQLHDKVDELEATTNDLTNLLRSTDIATLFLDRECRIKRFTETIAELMRIIPSDVGRPLSDITRQFDDPSLFEDIKRVLDRLEPIERTVTANQGRTFVRRVLPYRTADHRIEGVVLTFVDISALERARRRIVELNHELEKTVDQRTRELQTETARLRLVLDTAADAIISSDEKGTIEYFNAAAEAAFGYKAEELIGQNVRVLMPTPDREQHDDYLKRYLATSVPRIIGVGREVTGRKKDGTTFPMFLALGELEIDGDRKFTAFINDLSELRNVEEALRVSEARFRSVFESTGGGIVQCDLDGRILEANNTFCSFLGFGQAELTTRTLFELAHKDDVDSSKQGFDDVIAQRALFLEQETRFVRHDGGTVWGHLTGAAVQGASGTPEFAIILVQDRTQQKRTEQELALRESYLRSIIAGAQEAIFTIDDDGKIISFYPSAERLTGFRASEVIGREATELLSADSPLVDTLPVAPLAVTISTKAGGSIPIELSIGRIDHLALHVCIAHDVSERARLETELRHSQKMEALGSLAAGVAHDFNNLLMGVRGCATIALDTLDRSSPARQYFDEIRRAVDGGAAIARRLLLFSHKGEIESTVFELNEVVAGAQKLLGRLLGEDVDFVVRLDATDSHIMADPGQLEQVLINLAVNARDAMPRGGRLEIVTSSVTIRAGSKRSLEPGDYVALRVTDSGTGMTEETRQKIFDPFFTTKGSGKGTGLGLSTVFGIIKQAGGRIDVTSELGKGTTFEILVPLAQAPRTAEAPAAATERSAPENRTVLVVEDEPLIRMTARYFLEKGGYRVLEANDGREAVECCAQHDGAIDLLLTDVVLPGMSGPEIARSIREVVPGLEVIYMSAHPQEWLEQNDRIELTDRSIQKPFDADALLTIVADALAAEPVAATS